MITLQEAERIRKALNLTVYEFSTRLGYSATAYRYAKEKKQLSRWMAREISTRYGRVLSEVRQ